jgi:hypothetical protein
MIWLVQARVHVIYTDIILVFWFFLKWWERGTYQDGTALSKFSPIWLAYPGHPAICDGPTQMWWSNTLLCHLQIGVLLIQCWVAYHWCRIRTGIGLGPIPVKYQTVRLSKVIILLRWQRSGFFLIESFLSIYWFYPGVVV